MAISEVELYDFLKQHQLVSDALFELTPEDQADGYSTVKEKLDGELLKDLSDNYAIIRELGQPGNKELIVFFSEDGIADYVVDVLKYEMDDDAVVRLIGDLSNGFADVLTLWRMEPKQEGEFMVANTTKTTASKLASILKTAKGIGKYRRGDVLTDVTSVSPGQLLVLDSIKYKAVDLIKVTQTFKDKFYSVFVNAENPVELRSKGDEEFAVYATDLKQGEYYIALEPSPTAITPEVDDGSGEKTTVAPVPEAEQKPVPEEKPELNEEIPAPEAKPEKEAVGASKKTADSNSEPEHYITVSTGIPQQPSFSKGVRVPSESECRVWGVMSQHGPLMATSAEKEQALKVWQHYYGDETPTYWDGDRSKFVSEVEASKKTANDLPEGMVDSYLVTALWSSTEPDPENDSVDTPLDREHDISDIAPESWAKAEKDCNSFLARAKELVSKLEPELVLDEAMVGHDFWLTRNGHGAGFWDGDYSKEVGDALTKLSKEYGECDAIVGDDGLIYLKGGKEVGAAKKTAENKFSKQYEAAKEDLQPLIDKWGQKGVEAGENDSWMQPTLEGVTEKGITDVMEAVQEEEEGWEQTNHFGIKYKSPLMDDVRDHCEKHGLMENEAPAFDYGGFDIMYDLKESFWQGWEEATNVYKKIEKAIAAKKTASVISQVSREIEKEKSRLVEKANSKGIYENFGQDEVRKLRDKYPDYAYGSTEERQVWDLISKFNEWVMNFSDKDIERGVAKKTAIESPVRKQLDYGELPATAAERQEHLAKKIADLDSKTNITEAKSEPQKIFKNLVEAFIEKENKLNAEMDLKADDPHNWLMYAFHDDSSVATDSDLYDIMHEEADYGYGKELRPQIDADLKKAGYYLEEEGGGIYKFVKISAKKTAIEKTAIGGDDTAANVLNPPDANPITVDVPTHTSYSRYVEDTKTATAEEASEPPEAVEAEGPKYELEIVDNPVDEEFPADSQPTEDDIVINEDYPGPVAAYYGGKEIATAKDGDIDSLADPIAAWMEEHKYWPNVWGQRERGAVVLYVLKKIGALDNFELDQEIMTSGGYAGAVGSHVSNITSLLANTETLASAPGGEGDDGAAYSLAEDREFTGVNEDLVTATVDEYLNGKAVSLASFEDFAGFVEDVYGIKKEASVVIADAWYNADPKAIVAFIKENAVQDLLG